MRQYVGESADEVWREAATELINCPEYTIASRGGITIEFLQCSLSILDPRRRWILSRSPAYNPAFGLVELVWIFNGKDNSDVLKFWNPKLPIFTGISKNLHGAYGHRLRKHFEVDQIRRAYSVLKSNPSSRQVVLQIWDPCQDLPDQDGNPASEDIPCNLMALLKIRDGRLYWTQVMRSNDVMRGLPYNIIQFTMLQELFAAWLECEMGSYVHVSDSLHIYKDSLETFEVMQDVSSKTSSTEYEKLEMTFDETSELLSSIYNDLIAITQLHHECDRSAISNKLFEIFHPNSNENSQRPRFIRNILSVIGSDAARRLNEQGLAFELLTCCTDMALQKAARDWIIRNQTKGNKNG